MQYRQDKVGVFVDAEWIADNGGYGMRFDVLRDFAVRDVLGPALMLNAYVQIPDLDDEDSGRLTKALNFQGALRDCGFRVIEADEPARVLSSEVPDRSSRLDRVVLATGGEDASSAVEDLVLRGHRVELVGFEGVPTELKDEADLFMSGYLVPNLLPCRGGVGAWGEVGSRVRGVCYSFSHDRGFGFIRYMVELGDVAMIDTRAAGSPYKSAFVHESEIPSSLDPAADLPSRDLLFEFTLADSDRGMQARDVVLVGQS